MATILVTGANGQVGQELLSLSKAFPQFSFEFTGKTELDITNAQKVKGFFRRFGFDYCINCAAYTAVDKAESEAELARAVNVEGVKNLAETCALLHVPLITFSTDYVYHNHRHNTPFNEDDAVSPHSVYAATKLEGEQAALRQHPMTMVIRTSWVYSAFGHNFVKTMLRLGKEHPEVRVVYDQIGTPTYARDLALAVLNILQMVDSGEVDRAHLSGIYHYSNEGVASWYDFAKAIFDLRGINTPLFPIETADFPTPAKRPPFSLLNKAKIKDTFNIEIPYWRDSLKFCLHEIR